MSELPHIYRVTVEGKPTSSLTATAANLPALEVAPPAEFGGPGDKWSPEQLLMASVANCFVLSFRAIANASRLEWSSIECLSEGTLDRVNSKVQFTRIVTRATLTLPATQDSAAAQAALTKAEQTCFISNSLSCESTLECELIVGGE